MFETPGFSAAVRQYVLESAPVLALILDASGRVVKANVQALRLLGKDTVGRLLTEKLADPTQVFDVAALTGSDAPALFTFVTVSRMPESLYFRFFSHSGSIFALGSMDFEEQQKLFGELTALNGELNGLTRKLQQANAELRELNELKTRHARQAQEHMESMRLQGLASLNLMEDALEARKRAEQAIQALRESEAQFRDLVEGAPDAIFVQVGDRFAYVNPAAMHLFGAASREQILGERVLDLLDPAFHAFAEERARKILVAREPLPVVELVCLTLDGRKVPIEVAAVPMMYEGRQAALRFVRDISERKRVEKELSQTEQKYRSLLEAAPDAILLANQAGEVVLVNSRAESMFGGSRNGLLGLPARQLFAGEYKQPRCEPANPAAELFGVRRDGSRFPAEISRSELDTDGERLTFLSVRDVAERRNADLRNRQLEIVAARAEAANKAKSTFLSTMSHEIRTPMNAILGFSQLLLRDQGLSAEAAGKLKIITRSGQHLLDLISDVLDMAKIEAGRAELTPKLFSLSELLGDMESMFRMRAESKGVRFETVVEGEAMDLVVADEGKVRQVLINILGNALKFTDQGRIRLSLALQSRPDGKLWLGATVEDTGAGMTAEELALLFEPFAQGHLGRQLQHRGSGLGLSIGQALARLMGGEITVTSVRGSGSVFRFDLPVERGETPEDGGQPQDCACRVIGIQGRGPAPRILIADDLADNSFWLSSLLGGLGFAIQVVENGEDAVRAWREWGPDLILMDVHMPVLDGKEATRLIKTGSGGRPAVVIGITADAREEHRREVLAEGADDFIAKPCTEKDLLDKIAFHLGIEYLYAPNGEGDVVARYAQGSGLDAQDLTSLPPELTARLLGATQNGDKALLDELIAAVGEGGHRPAAHALQTMADQYQYDRLTELLEQACCP